MTRPCPECECEDVELVGSNDTRDDESTRVDVLECQDCEHCFGQVTRP